MVYAMVLRIKLILYFVMKYCDQYLNQLGMQVQGCNTNTRHACMGMW
jgi:hypothetical protein